MSCLSSLFSCLTPRTRQSIAQAPEEHGSNALPERSDRLNSNEPTHDRIDRNFSTFLPDLNPQTAQNSTSQQPCTSALGPTSMLGSIAEGTITQPSNPSHRMGVGTNYTRINFKRSHELALLKLEGAMTCAEQILDQNATIQETLEHGAKQLKNAISAFPFIPENINDVTNRLGSSETLPEVREQRLNRSLGAMRFLLELEEHGKTNPIPIQELAKTLQKAVRRAFNDIANGVKLSDDRLKPVLYILDPHENLELCASAKKTLERYYRSRYDRSQ